MTDTTVPMGPSLNERAWIRLRTQIVLRWFTIAGQLFAVLGAEYFLNLQINFGLAYVVIGLSAVANMVAGLVYPENKRLSESEARAMVVFDSIQLACLLFLTGGLHNPFCMLLLGPVVVAANATGLRSTVLVGALTILCSTILALFYIPLYMADGTILEMPPLFVFGNWGATAIAVCFIGAYSTRINQEIRAMSEALAATQMALAREQKLTDLGGVVAAAAHELGTPLATIKLTSSELIDELEDQPQLIEDARLIRDQADRCRVILRNMGRAGKDDLHMKNAPVSTLVYEAAHPHSERGIELIFDEAPAQGGPIDQPDVRRRPEIIHGLRNLIQNAVDFARSRVLIETRWTEDRIEVRILDDGPGFAPHTLGRLGDPFLRRRDAHRPGYEGMGLGLFIAKTLLERTGAEVTFSNGGGEPEARSLRPAGAAVLVSWARPDIEAPEAREATSKNRLILS